MTALPSLGRTVVCDLDADAITGKVLNDPIATLPDRAQARDATQTTTGYMPTYNPSSSNFNGHATVTFDGTDDHLHQTAALAAPIGDRTVAFIGRISTTTDGQRWLDGTTSTTDNQIYYTSSGAGMTSAFATTRIDFGLRKTTPQVQLVYFTDDSTSTVSFAQQNGGERALIGAATGTDPYDMIRIGAGHDLASSSFTNVEVTRIVIWEEMLSDADIITFDTWVQDTYGIAVDDYAGAVVAPSAGWVVGAIVV